MHSQVCLVIFLKFLFIEKKNTNQKSVFESILQYGHWKKYITISNVKYKLPAITSQVENQSGLFRPQLSGAGVISCARRSHKEMKWAEGAHVVELDIVTKKKKWVSKAASFSI